MFLRACFGSLRLLPSARLRQFSSRGCLGPGAGRHTIPPSLCALKERSLAGQSIQGHPPLLHLGSAGLLFTTMFPRQTPRPCEFKQFPFGISYVSFEIIPPGCGVKFSSVFSQSSLVSLVLALSPPSSFCPWPPRTQKVGLPVTDAFPLIPSLPFVPGLLLPGLNCTKPPPTILDFSSISPALCYLC